MLKCCICCFLKIIVTGIRFEKAGVSCGCWMYFVFRIFDLSDLVLSHLHISRLLSVGKPSFPSALNFINWQPRMRKIEIEMKILLSQHVFSKLKMFN